MERAGFEADRFRILLRDWPHGETTVLTEDWDRSVGSMTFSPDGRTLLVTAQNLGNTSLFTVDVASGEVREILHEGTIRSPAFAGDRIVFETALIAGHDHDGDDCRGDGRGARRVRPPKRAVRRRRPFADHDVLSEYRQ